MNNNNNGWAYIRCGSKSAETTSTITSPVIDEAVTEYQIVVDKTSGVTSCKLEVVTDTVVESKDVTLEAGTVKVSLTGTKGASYKLTIENEKVSSNGTTQISSIIIVKAVSEGTAKKPTLSEACTFMTSTYDVVIKNNEEGATVYYTIDGSEISTESPSFTADSMIVNIEGTTTVKAMAVKDGLENSDTVSVTYTYEASVANTAETAYTTAEAIALIDAGNKQLTATEVYVKGIVSKVDGFNSKYGSITYWLDEDAFEVYSGLSYEGAQFENKYGIYVGDTVVVKGLIKKYGSVYEFNYNNVLVARNITINKSIADEVVALFKAIGTVEATDECKAKIDAADAAYEALTDAQKAIITEEELQILEDAKKAYTTLTASVEISADKGVINTLTEAEEVITVSAKTAGSFSALQFTVVLPEGVEVVEGSAAKGSILAEGDFNINVNKNSAGAYVVVVTSNKAEAMKANVDVCDVVSFRVKATQAVYAGKIVIENVLASTNTDTPKLVTADGTKIAYSANLLIRGDVDDDRLITVNDYNFVRHYVLGMIELPATYAKEYLAADANEDEAVDVADVEAVAALINGEGKVYETKTFFGAAEAVEGLSLVQNGNELSIVAANASQFLGCQMDIQLPAGVKVVSKHTDADHTVATNMVNGACRVLVTSENVSTFYDNVIATIVLSEDAEVTANNIVFANTACQRVQAELGKVTGVNNANVDADANNGKYIKNGNIVIVKAGKQYNVKGQLVK